MQIEEDKSFKYLFVALDASIKGLKKCKPIIFVDGTFLKSKYGGTFLYACTQDGNGHIFPLAFSVVDSENNSSWQWLFTKLRETYRIRQEQCLILDRHESIINAAAQVVPKITHGYCVYHLLSNLKATFKKNARKIDKLFFAAATTYIERKIEYHMSELDNLDICVRPYLQQFGYHKWSRYHSKHNRYSTMTSNNAESLNAENLEARELPITTVMESLRALIQQWTYTNRKKAQKTTTFLTPTVEKKLVNNFVDSSTENLKPINESMFEVVELTRSWVINLKEKTCSCNQFQIDELPCAHALAVIKEMNLNVYNYCSNYYTTRTWLETYSGSTYLVHNHTAWDVPQNIKDILVLPPNQKIRSGRPRKRRFIADWDT
ncbi:uncharacterized protein LOC115723662 [Cannabis sativa]|uniref:uncharacterized protein LOC115723662 n=1 Tax=Cannabis sativa TaxID=3483 RepID=UPI0029CA6986|nr:uncharacterized protein LOC115723662 [Cannabis sativa]